MNFQFQAVLSWVFFKALWLIASKTKLYLVAHSPHAAGSFTKSVQAIAYLMKPIKLTNAAERFQHTTSNEERPLLLLSWTDTDPAPFMAFYRTCQRDAWQRVQICMWAQFCVRLLSEALLPAHLFPVWRPLKLFGYSSVMNCEGFWQWRGYNNTQAPGQDIVLVLLSLHKKLRSWTCDKWVLNSMGRRHQTDHR
jgi:hypothetical protein